MYLARLSEAKLRELKSAFQGNPGAEDVLARLKKGCFKVFYSFNSKKKTILYEAFDESGVYLHFAVNQMKEIDFSSNPAIPSDALDEAFAFYIAEKEGAMSDEDLIKAYEDDYPAMGRFALLSYEKAQAIATSGKALDEFKKTLYDSLPQTVYSVMPRLFFGFHKRDGGSLFFDAYASVSFARKKIPNIRSFLEAFENRGVYEGRGVGTIDFSRPTSSDEFLSLISRFKDHDNQYYSYYYGRPENPWIEKRYLPYLLFALVGEEVVLDEANFLIPEVEEASFVEKEDGSIETKPSLAPGGEAYFGEKLGFYVDKDKRNCHLLSFPDLASMRYFEFLLNNPYFSFEEYGKELKQALSPFLAQSKPSGEKKGKGDVSDIAFYLSYEDDGSLLCHTEFYIGGETVSGEKYASSSPIRKEKKERFLASLSSFSLQMEGPIKDEKAILAILSYDLSPLRMFCHFYLDDEIAHVRIRPVSKISFSLSEGGNNWFELTASSDAYSLEELEKIAASYRKKKNFVLIKGSYLDLSSLKDTLAGDVFSKVDDLKSPHLPLPVALGLSSFKEDGVKLDEKSKKILGEIYDYQSADISSMPKKLASYLRPYQQSGVKWMKELGGHGLGGILGDEMGLGKTLQAIAFLSLREENLPSLICAPKSLLYNWKAEFKKFNPSQKVIVLPCESKERTKIIRAMGEEKTVYITSYDSVRIDAELYKEKRFDCLIIDEAQFIANSKAQKSVAVKSIRANCRFALTGTPIQNSLLDLWSIFDYFLPGYFPEYKEFSSQYGKLDFASEEKKKRLEAKIAPFLLKRSKEEVAIELPPKEESNVFLSLGEKQRKTYEAYLALARGELKLGDGNRIAILAALTRLRQICVSPELFLEKEKDSVKIDYVMSSLEELLPAGHKALIFSSFTKALDLVSERLGKEKIKHGYIHGEVSASERVEMVDEFNNDPETKVMLVSLKAGGTGLNLTGADTVFLLDPWWNLAAEEQAFARAHRIGQTKSVSIFRLVCEQTVEEKVLALQKRKKELTTILGGVSSQGLEKEDIAFLLS